MSSTTGERSGRSTSARVEPASLASELAFVRAALERHLGQAPAAVASGPGQSPAPDPLMPDDRHALDFIDETFGLTPFERSLLLLCLGCELDSAIGSLCARATGVVGPAVPTFGLALSTLPEPHWGALAPNRALRYWQLLEVGPGASLSGSPLRIDERILNFILDIRHRDERLSGLLEVVSAEDGFVPSHLELAARLARVWERCADREGFPVVQLCGRETAGKWNVAARACDFLNRSLVRMPADALPTAPADLDRLVRLWQREVILSGDVLLLDCEDVDSQDGAREGTVQRFVSTVGTPLILSGRQRRRPRGRPLLTIDVDRPTPEEQRSVWRALTGEVGGESWIAAVVSQFDLSAPTIRAAFAGALGDDPEEDAPDFAADAFGRTIWSVCRTQARASLEALSQRIRSKATWDALVLPAPQKRTLREIASQVRHRSRVYESWGFGRKESRGFGITALFAGVSGTGKTMAAEAIATELDLDLFRIDLSGVVSKYIGDTEKNLKRVFDEAEECGAILLFDEADAIFGKRSEVKDSHDRYANIEVSYLLQRMESYRGLAILTTNQKEALDPAFMRRLRFIVVFPFPSVEERVEIWRGLFPEETPTEGLQLDRLAQLNLAGGNLRSIALNAAFLAAAANRPVSMEHILRAARGEYVKLEKILSDSELRGWPAVESP